jgi:hypothetical protein
MVPSGVPHGVSQAGMSQHGYDATAFQEAYRTTQRWRSVYGAMVYVRCHPPANAMLVAAWEGEV